MYLLYSALLALVLLLGSPYWLFEMWRHGKYRRGLTERLGFVPRRILDPRKRSIWVHAVSVGEVLAVSELIKGMRAQFQEHHILVSTTTDAGQRLAAGRFGSENVFYFPFDFKYCLIRYFDALRPELMYAYEPGVRIRAGRFSGVFTAFDLEYLDTPQRRAIVFT